MRNRLAVVALLLMGSAIAQDALDETGQWGATGKGTIAKADAPAPVEGDAALRCTVEEKERGYLYFRVAPPTPDLAPFARLRFRICGDLDRSELHEIVIHDAERRYCKWRTQSLATRSREPRWTEFLVYLNSPAEDKGVDMHNVSSITWRVLVRGGGEGTKSFFLDGVRLERAEPSAVAGLESVVLEHKQYQAVFSAKSQFELASIRTPDGATIPVSTDIQMMPLDTAEPEGTTVALGGTRKWRKFEALPDRLHVEYEQGDFLHENTFAWEGGALAVRRRVSCLRAGVGGHGSRLHVVSFGEALGRCVYEHGSRESAGALPTKSLVPMPGNWCAVAAQNGVGAGVIFPRRVLYSCTVGGREFVVSDGANFSRNDLPQGAHIEHEIWIVPLAGESPGAQCREATRSICTRLAEQHDPALAYFTWRYQPSAPAESTLFSNDDLALWQASAGATIPIDAAPPGHRADGVSLALARGETEPIHLAITAKRPMKNVSVRCAPLRQDDLEIAADRFRVRYPGYVDIRRVTEEERTKLPKTDERSDCARFVGVIDGAEQLTTDRLYGAWARSLGCVEDPVFDRAAVDVQPGRNQPIWITLAAPVDARPGTYRGEIALAEDGRDVCRVPIEVTVWSFALPRVTSLWTWYQLWNYPESLPFWREYYRDLAEHKVSGFGGTPGSIIEDGKTVPVGPGVRLENGKVVADWAKFDQVSTYLFDELGMRHAKLPHGKRGGGHVHVSDFAGLKEGTPEFEKAFYDYLCQAREHLGAKGWLKDLDCYIFDEPDKERIEVIRRTAPIVCKALPEMRVFPACARNTRSLIGVLNAWCPPVSYFGLPYGEFNAERVEAGRKRGETFLWYNQGDNCIGAPISTHRALPWATWAAGVDGYFVWSINYWGTKQFPYAVVYEVGEANALYPGKGGPVDSMRWEQTRDGLEDFDYLAMLAKAMERPGAPEPLAARGRAALDRARALFPDPRCLIGVNPRELQELRDEIGDILNQLSK